MYRNIRVHCEISDDVAHRFRAHLVTLPRGENIVTFSFLVPFALEVRSEKPNGSEVAVRVEAHGYASGADVFVRVVLLSVSRDGDFAGVEAEHGLLQSTEFMGSKSQVSAENDEGFVAKAASEGVVAEGAVVGGVTEGIDLVEVDVAVYCFLCAHTVVLVLVALN